MYSNLHNLVYAFHGCDMDTYNRVLHCHESLMPSCNPYDWLGNGIYFLENSLSRAEAWAREHCERYNKNNPDKTPKKPAVIGAIIDLGHCLNLTDYSSLDMLTLGYEILSDECSSNNKSLPNNIDIEGNNDLLIRKLDCAVIQRIHQFNEVNNFRGYDSVRGVFVEGEPVYANSGIMSKTHIQICVVNPNCIKGYFKPLISNKEWNAV